MKYETIRDLTLPKIGFGTWKLGGASAPDPALEERSLAALCSAIELGYTHFDTAEKYADGYTEKLLGRALREMSISREKVFITSKVWPNHLRSDDVLRACAGSLRRLNTEYIDLYLIHWPNELVPLKESFRALNQLVREGRVRHIGVSNFTLRLLKQAYHLAETPLATDQVPLSVDERTYLKNGVLAYCQQNDILLTAYSPVEGGHLRAKQVLQAIADKRRITPWQVALAWLISQPRVITIPMSLDPHHQAENLASVEVALSPSEFEQLSNL